MVLASGMPASNDPLRPAFDDSVAMGLLFEVGSFTGLAPGSATCRMRIDGAREMLGRWGSKNTASSAGVRVNRTCSSRAGVGDGGAMGI